jgi:hypothetical protein
MGVRLTSMTSRQIACGLEHGEIDATGARAGGRAGAFAGSRGAGSERASKAGRARTRPSDLRREREGRRFRLGIAVAAGPLEEMWRATLATATTPAMILSEAVSTIGGVEDDVLVEERPGYFGTIKRHERCYVFPK